MTPAPFPCPGCGDHRTPVQETRPTGRANAMLVRRRRCAGCDWSFNTYEILGHDLKRLTRGLRFLARVQALLCQAPTPPGGAAEPEAEEP